MRLSINVPSNNPESYLRYFAPTITNLRSMFKTCDINVCIVAQPPWSKKMLKKEKHRLAQLGFGMKWVMEEARANPSMNRLRRLGLSLDNKADYFMIADDNLVFKKSEKLGTSGKHYARCLKYLEAYPACGLVQCEGSLGSAPQGQNIFSGGSNSYWTCYGLILRNIGVKQIMPKKLDKLVSGCEESVMVWHIIEKGFYPAKQFMNPTSQAEKKRSCDGHKSTIHDTILHRGNNEAYINERYCDGSWAWAKKRFPKGIPKMYADAGGDPSLLMKYQNIMDF